MEENIYYENPLITRYTSKEMAENFGGKKRYGLWRKLWIALAESEKELGLNIQDTQIQEMKKYQDDIDFEVVKEFENKLRHDVMAHLHAFGTQAKSAMPIIHLGATSCFVTDNAEIILIDNALKIIKKKLINVIDKLSKFAYKYKGLATLSYTHLQPAQLTTVGKRATLYIQDLMLDLENIDFILDNIKLRGVKGTTGTQASFMELFNGDTSKIKKLEKLVVNKMGYDKAYSVTGQTYPRKFDSNVLSVLSMIAQSSYRFANDIRILQSFKEIEEPFEKNQIGSSAMAYKRNPMRTERMCSLCRYVISLPINTAITSSTQWFERTLDDSANKRIVIPESFMAVDGILNIFMNVTDNLVVYEKVIKKRINSELPFMATENIMMECVKRGKNRQEIHEKIRVLSMQAGKNVKEEGLDNNLIELIKKDKDFDCVKDMLDNILDANNFTGRAEEQTEEYLKGEVFPMLEKYKDILNISGEVTV